jgi:uncharacterized protein YebE (UPF0316 family)
MCLLQVSRFLAAASSSFEALPLSQLGLGLVLELFSLLNVLLDARAKLGKVPITSLATSERCRVVSMICALQVSRFLAAASSSFEALPLSQLGLGLVLELFSLPQLMLDAPEMARVVGKARAKLLELYGDLEKVSNAELKGCLWVLSCVRGCCMEIQNM